jgi:hypothetical protein
MYPHRTPIMQFETREARLAREHVAIHKAESAASSRAAGAAPRFLTRLFRPRLAG